MFHKATGIDAKYVDDGPFAAKGFSNSESTAQLPRHRWYHLKEGFSAALVEQAIASCLEGQDAKLQLLEPFCGTGTTPVAAALKGHHCTAIEVNPFLAFAARVKSSAGQWREGRFCHNLERVVEASARELRSPLEGYSTFTEREGLTKWLFNTGVLRRFTALNRAIARYGGVYSGAMKLSALVAAYDCCNAKRDGKALRYKRDWRELDYSGGDLVTRFRAHALTVLGDVLNAPIHPTSTPRVHTGDSRVELARLQDDCFDLVVTSPPYLNSFDYSDIYRPELFLGRYVADNSDLRELRLATVRSHVQVGWPQEVSFQSPLLSPVLEELKQSESLWDARIPLMVRAYFDDMLTIFKALKPKMHVSGKVWMVVSTSAYGGVHIPVDFIVADAADQAGFSLEAIHRLRDLRAAGQQWRQFKTTAPPLRESLIILSNR